MKIAFACALVATFDSTSGFGILPSAGRISHQQQHRLAGVDRSAHTVQTLRLFQRRSCTNCRSNAARPLQAAHVMMMMAAAETEDDVSSASYGESGSLSPSSSAVTSAAVDGPALSTERLILEAEKYKLQAEQLRLEAEKESLALDTIKLKQKDGKDKKSDVLIDMLLAAFAADGESFKVKVEGNLSRINVEFFARVVDRAEAAKSVEQEQILLDMAEQVMQAIQEQDERQARLMASKVRDVLTRTKGNIFDESKLPGASLVGGGLDNKENVMEQWLRGAQVDLPGSSSIDGKNVTMTNDGGADGQSGMFGIGSKDGSFKANVIVLPLWVPSSLLAYVAKAPAMLPEDINMIKDNLFGIDSFYVSAVQQCSCAALFQGNVRGNQTAGDVFAAACRKLETLPGVKDRIQLFLMEDPSPPEPDASGRRISRPTDVKKPVIMAISKQAQPSDSGALTLALGAVTLLVTAFTAFAYALGTFALNAEFYQKVIDGDVSVAITALPVAGGVLLLQALHELGHVIMAALKKQKLGLPILLPSLQIGCFGAITPLLSFPKDRKDLFDVSVSGPLVGIFASLAALIAGLALTVSASPEVLAAFPVVPAGLFHSSLLIGGVVATVLPSVMLSALSVPTPVHPLTVIGITGVIVNALNLLPTGRLDGGRISTSVYGRKTAAVIGTFTLLLQAVSAIFNSYSLQLFWGICIILFQRQQDVPPQDQITEVGDGRKVLSWILLLFSIIALVPFPALTGAGAPMI